MSGHDIARVTSWVSKSGQLIKTLCPKDNVYFERFSSILKEKGTLFYNIHSNHYEHLGIILGCVKAVFDDFQRGLLKNIKSLLRAEIFGDFLEMAEYLLNEGYKDPAAVLIGAVLENSLKKLAIQNGLSIKKAGGALKTIEPLNQELYKDEVYNKLVQKQVTSWGELRNNAAHGDYDKYDAEQVRMMLLFVQKFCSEHLS